MSIFPGALDTPAGTAAQGGSLLTAPDHAQDHRVLGSAVVGIETFLGTNAATNVFTGFNFGDHAAKRNFDTLGSPTINAPQINNGTIGTALIIGGTYNNGVFGSATLQSPTINGQGTNSGTLSKGVYGTATWQGGTINNASIGTPTITGASIAGGTFANVAQASSIYMTGTQGIGSATFGTVIFGTALFDPSGMFGTANPTRLTAQITGYYQITGNVSWNPGLINSSSRVVIRLDVNGTAATEVDMGQNGNNTRWDNQISTLLQLNANDYIELTIFQTAALNPTLGTGAYNTTFSMARIGQL